MLVWLCWLYLTTVFIIIIILFLFFLIFDFVMYTQDIHALIKKKKTSNKIQNNITKLMHTIECYFLNVNISSFLLYYVYCF